MRLRAVFVSLVIAAGCFAVGTVGYPAQAQAQTCGPPHGPLVAYGHSYLHSPRLGGAPASYATLAATTLRVKPVIRAVDRGSTLDIDTLVHNGPTKWVPGASDLVIIDSSINDIEKGIPAAQWTAALRHTLTAFVPPPVPTILLVRPLQVRAAAHPGRNIEVIAGYAAAQRKVAAEFSAVRIVNATAGWNPLLDLGLDGVHPNQVGMVHIARSVDSTARQAFCAP